MESKVLLLDGVITWTLNNHISLKIRASRSDDLLSVCMDEEVQEAVYESIRESSLLRSMTKDLKGPTIMFECMNVLMDWIEGDNPKVKDLSRLLRQVRYGLIDITTRR